MLVLATVSALVDLLQPFRAVIYPAFFVGFFVATGIALLLHRNRYVRTTYVAGFFALLLLVNLVVPAHVLPLLHWHKFSEPYSQDLVWQEVRLVDEHGREVVYDDKGTLGVDGVKMEDLQREMRTEYSDEQNCAVVDWLLERASVYRERVVDRPPHRWLRFPPHGLNNQWTSADLEGYGEFVGLRIYEQQVTTSSDGTEVTAYAEHRVFDTTAEGLPPGECAPRRTTERPRRGR